MTENQIQQRLFELAGEIESIERDLFRLKFALDDKRDEQKRLKNQLDLLQAQKSPLDQSSSQVALLHLMNNILRD